MRVLLLGCGDLGNRTGQLLLQQQHQVWGARRSLNRLSSGIQPLAWTLPEPAPQLPQLDYVIYTLSADGFNEDAYRLAYLDGVQVMLQSLVRQKIAPRRIFFISSTGVYTQNQGETVDENSSTQPLHFSGQLLLQGEEALHQSPWPVTILRFSGIYGPGRERLIRQVRAGEFPAATPLKYSNRVHIEDGARALVHLLERDAAQQPLDDLYLVSDCEPAPLQEVTGWLAHQMGLQVHPGNQVPERGGNKRINSQRLRDTGFQFRYPSYREGYAPLLDATAS
ncbi:NAD-dependent epimerase/dehydratase family protein [Marinospirillum alkaliphilum]|uniref:Nucleoside-diphosphate-sugar epimerase n=1 Tax=Marinospirillum alkaliphilum DSM 21637 TaxID=1122209 RepID=A0A1K1Z5Z1_9GAMM|nr:NAD-dependent epimerase/dehydratase family protein [Marinospirillum alkaliphilum]SFX69690.1 Nucleoside-diphosphate-sugar epimerase [Marinospirillum alkaliphilum DSM 21637]